MLRTNDSTEFSALGKQAATLAWLQIPIDKRRALHRKVAKRQQQQAPAQTAGTNA
jgi:hypothetical protein